MLLVTVFWFSEKTNKQVAERTGLGPEAAGREAEAVGAQVAATG